MLSKPINAMCFNPLGCLQIPLAPGIAGPAGNTVLYGAGAPSSGLGTNGNFYINTSSWLIYGPKASGAWPSGVSLVGASGAAVLSGSGVPSSGLGLDGDFYINTSANTIYGPKTGGAWGSATSLVGDAGPSGIGVISSLGAGTSYTAITTHTLPPGGVITVAANQLCANNGDVAKIHFYAKSTVTAIGSFGAPVNFAININGVTCSARPVFAGSPVPPTLNPTGLSAVFLIKLTLTIRRISSTSADFFMEVNTGGASNSGSNCYVPDTTGVSLNFAASTTIGFTGELTAASQTVQQVQSFIERGIAA